MVAIMRQHEPNRELSLQPWEPRWPLEYEHAAHTSSPDQVPMDQF